MKPLRRWMLLLLALACGAGGVAWAFGRTPDLGVETIGVGRREPPADVRVPGLCPWRQPQSDMNALFPGANNYQTRTLFLSGLRLAILKRLGRGGRLESNVLYLYPIWQERRRRGIVLVDRTAGEYGAIEVVVGVNPAGRVAGVRLQRYREPPEVAKAILSPRWLGAFAGKTANSPLRLGNDIPSVPHAATASAATVVRAVRALLIEDDVAERSIAARK